MAMAYRAAITMFGDAQGLYRFFGDVNGDQNVNGLDFGFFKNAFGTQTGDANYLSYLDFNGDGVINGFDFGQFRTRFGTMCRDDNVLRALRYAFSTASIAKT